jgi:hypothetical protein
MSLKGFHVVFISAAVLLAAGVGVSYLRTYAGADGTANLVAGLAAFGAAAGLIAYERWVIRKSRTLP